MESFKYYGEIKIRIVKKIRIRKGSTSEFLINFFDNNNGRMCNCKIFKQITKTNRLDSNIKNTLSLLKDKGYLVRCFKNYYKKNPNYNF